MMKMKKNSIRWVTAALVMILMAGCSVGGTGGSGSGDAEPGKETLTFWMKKQMFEEQNQMIQERAKQFGEEHGVNVNVEFIAYEDFYPKWSAAIESGTTPDVSFFGYQEVGQFYAKDVLEEVTDVVGSVENANGEIQDSLKTSVTFENKLYGVPFWTESTALYYRKDMLQAAGYSEPPGTWEEFREMAKALTDSSKGIYGAGLGYGKGNSDAEWLTRAIIWSYGGSLDTEDGKNVAVNSPETLQAVQLIRDIFIEDRVTPPSSIGWDDSGNNKSYLSGQSAMIFNVGSLAATIKNDNPELYENTGIAMLPAGPKGAVVPGISNNLGIFKASANKELAKSFIEYMTDKAWYGQWVQNGAPLTGPIYTDLANESVWQEEKNKGFVDSIAHFAFLGYPAEYSPKAGEIYNLRYVNDVFQKMLLDSGFTAQQAVDELQNKIEAVYAK